MNKDWIIIILGVVLIFFGIILTIIQTLPYIESTIIIGIFTAMAGLLLFVTEVLR